MPATCIICGKHTTLDIWRRCYSCGMKPPTRNRWGERICKHGKRNSHYLEDPKKRGNFTVLCVGGNYLAEHYLEELDDSVPGPRIIETEIRGCEHKHTGSDWFHPIERKHEI